MPKMTKVQTTKYEVLQAKSRTAHSAIYAFDPGRDSVWSICHANAKALADAGNVEAKAALEKYKLAEQAQFEFESEMVRAGRAYFENGRFKTYYR